MLPSIKTHTSATLPSINIHPSLYSLLLAVESGVGLAALPNYMAVGKPGLVKVLPEITGPKYEAHFVYPQSLKNVARVKAFRDFIFSKIKQWEF